MGISSSVLHLGQGTLMEHIPIQACSEFNCPYPNQGNRAQPALLFNLQLEEDGYMSFPSELV